MNCRTSVQMDNQSCFQIAQIEAVQRLGILIQSYLPAMAMSFRKPLKHEFALCGGNEEVVQNLYLAIQKSEPDAGRLYWSAQCWNMLCWQPVILNVVAASQFQLIADVRQIGQRVQGAGVAGLSIPETAFFFAQHTDSLISASGSLLKELLNTLLGQTSELFPINQNLAKRLFADRLLSTLLLLQRFNNNGQYSEVSNQHTEMLANQWLEAAGLQGASALMRLKQQSEAHSDSIERLAINRKGCCQHFRKSAGKVCASCPKNKMPERIRLIQQSWLEGAD